MHLVCLQWLLGRGIETIQELTTGVQAADMTQSRREQQQAKVVTCGTILLDPDIGDYCAMLASKPRLRAVPHRAEIMRMVRRATMRAALALRRAGLPVWFSPPHRWYLYGIVSPGTIAATY